MAARVTSSVSVSAFRDLEIGDVVTAVFPVHYPTGHEQEGYRPAVIIGLPELVGLPRFEVVLLAPFTSDRNQEWAVRSPHLYPRFAPATGTMRSASICLLDQIRALDRRRIVRRRGRLDAQDYAVIRSGLLAVFGQSAID